MHFLNSSIVRTFTNTFLTSFSVFFPSGSTAIATEGLIQQKVIASNAAINILFIDNNTFMSNKIIKVKSKRYQLQCQIFSCQAFTSSTGQIVPNLLWQGFDFIDREDGLNPSLARLSPHRSGVRSILQQSLELCLLAEDSVHRIWRSCRNARFSPI